MEQVKHGCVWLHHSAVRGDHVLSPLWSTSELTVYLHVHHFASGLKRGTGRDHGYKRHATHKHVRRVRASDAFLRFVVTLTGAAPVSVMSMNTPISNHEYEYSSQ